MTHETHKILRKNGKSFWFASLFLPQDVAADAATLYRFCRWMDDLADSGAKADAVARLEKVKLDLRARSSDDPVVASVLQIDRRVPLNFEALEHLVDALTDDASSDKQVKDEAELIRYCYGVAGTVGLAMSTILGANAERAALHAIDLGIAMQMTNIARDVLEDARKGRRYLPADWVENLSPRQLVEDVSQRDLVADAVRRLLDLADVYYAHGALGFPMIPAESRTGIRVAAGVYREIGQVLLERQYEWRGERAYVPLWRKSRIAAGVWIGSSRLERLSLARESSNLNRALEGLPGVR